MIWVIDSLRRSSYTRIEETEGYEEIIMERICIKRWNNMKRVYANLKVGFGKEFYKFRRMFLSLQNFVLFKFYPLFFNFISWFLMSSLSSLENSKKNLCLCANKNLS